MLLSFVCLSIFLALTTASPHRSRSVVIPLHKRSTTISDDTLDLVTPRAHARHSTKRNFLHGRATHEHRKAGARALSSSGFTQRDATPEPLIDNNNTRWFGTISVGTPPTDYTVVFGTGTGNTLLPGANCESSCAGHTLYDPNASSTAIYLHENFTMSFDDTSSAAGLVYSDTFTVEGFTATNLTFGVASQYSPKFDISRFAPDGVLGMAFPNMSIFRSNPFIQTLIAENQLPDPVFTFKLADSGSQLMIGDIDPSSYTGSITYTPVTKAGFWEIQLDSINVNGQMVTSNASAIIDTGSSYITANADTVASFYSSIGATDVENGFYAMPCDSIPNVSITIGCTDFAISPEWFNLGPYYNSTMPNYCVGAVVGNGGLGDTWILGDVFLRNVFSVFDVGNMQVGLATPA